METGASLIGGTLIDEELKKGQCRRMTNVRLCIFLLLAVTIKHPVAGEAEAAMNIYQTLSGLV